MEASERAIKKRWLRLMMIIDKTMGVRDVLSVI